MQDIRIDDEGNLRCFKCGGKNFDNKRTLGSKVALGVGALMTHKKMKCLACGEYNDTGSAKPFTGTAIEVAREIMQDATDDGPAPTTKLTIVERAALDRKLEEVGLSAGERLVAIREENAKRKATAETAGVKFESPSVVKGGWAEDRAKAAAKKAAKHQDAKTDRPTSETDAT